MLFFRPSPRSISVTLQRFNYSNCSCGVALRAAVRGAGDKELCKEGHHTASGAITRMNDRHPTPPKSAQLWDGGSPRVVPERQLL